MSDETLECDVLVVGGGPAGLSTAAALPNDVSCIVIHQDAEIGRPVRTSGGCWLQDAKRLRIPEEYYQIIDHLDIYSDHEDAKFEIKQNKLIVLNITDLYRWLARKLNPKSSQLLLATKFLSAQKGPEGHYVSSVRSRNTEVTKIKSKFIVDASGVRNAVVDQLGLRDKPDRVGVGIEYEYDIGQNRADTAILFVGSSVLSGYGWVFPTADGKLRVGVGILQPDTDVSPKTLMDDFLASQDIQRFGLNLEGGYEVNAGTIPSVAYDPKLVFGNIIRVGDSANFATPTVGEGIRICMEGGADLGHALGQAIRQNSAAPLLEFQSRSKRMLQTNYRFGFLANRRFSQYNQFDWDKSIRRVSRLSESELIALLRSEFTLKMILRASLRLIVQKAKGLFSRT